MSVAAADASEQLSSREQRKLDREERKRRRNAQEPTEASSTAKKEKIPGKEEKRKKKSDFTSNKGGTTVAKKPPSGTKRTHQTYDKVNIIEKTSPTEAREKENKAKSANEGEKIGSTRRRLGSKFLDNLSKFEGATKEDDAIKKERNPFVRSHSTQQANVEKQDPVQFRRSYRPSRSTPPVEDAAVLIRRSLRKERVLESIAKLEKNNSSDGKSMRKKPSSPLNENGIKSFQPEKKSTSRPSSAGSNRTSDSCSSTSSIKGQKTRAQQALERHKERMRNTTQASVKGPVLSPASPVSKSHSGESKPKTSKSKQKEMKSEKSLTRTPSTDDAPKRKISVTTSPLDGDDELEVTLETEVMTPMKEKMCIVVKEHVKSMEDVEEFMSPLEKIDEPEYKPGDPRPISVEDAVAIFSPEVSQPTTPKTPEVESPAPLSVQKKPKARRKLPEIPQQKNEPKERRRRKHSKKKKSDDGSGEPNQIVLEQREVVVVETSPVFHTEIIQSPENTHETSADQNSHHSDAKSPNFDPKSSYSNQRTGILDQKLSFEAESPKINTKKLAAALSFDSTGDIQKDREGNKQEPKKSKKSKKKSSSSSPKPFDPVPIIIEKTKTVASPEPIETKQETMRVVTEADEPMRVVVRNSSPVRSISPEDAIQVLRRLSEEVHSSGTSGRSSVTKHGEILAEENVNIDFTPEIEVEENQPQREGKETKSLEKRPSTLKIEEVFYIPAQEETPEPESPSDFHLSSRDSPKTKEKSPKKSERKLPKAPNLEVVGKDLPLNGPLFIKSGKSPESPDKSRESPIKSAESPIKIPSSPIKTPQIEKNSTNLKETPTFSPEVPVSPTKATSAQEIPISPVKSPLFTTSPTKLQSSPLPLISPAKTPVSPTKTLSIETPNSSIEPQIPPTKTPTSPTKTPTSPCKTPKSLTKTPTSPTKTPTSPSKTPKSLTRTPTSPTKTPTSPLKPTQERAQSPEKLPAVEKVESGSKPKKVLELGDKSVENTEKMTGKRGFVSRRAKQSWLDESDDDNISLLSDADSDDLEIDLKWLGSDSDDDHYLPKFRTTTPQKKRGSGDAGVQRSSSKATDMLAMWERKAVDSSNRNTSSPNRQIETEIKVGSVKAAWESKEENKREKRLSSSTVSLNGKDSPLPSPSPSPRHKLERKSSIDWQPKANDEEVKEMKDIFDDRLVGKIQGAKALFENLSQSPSRSPSSVKRSSRRVTEDTNSSGVSAEPSPELSRKSSIAENNSQESEENNAEQDVDVIEDLQRVDNMRAMFENQAKKKEQTAKSKPSRATSEKKSKPKSNIQTKIAARKKSRRSMTQPITTDDVIKAKDMMNESPKVEEEVLSFADRLKLFKGLCGGGIIKQRPKDRGESRFQTQPVDPQHLFEATALKKNKSGSQVDLAKREEPPQINLRPQLSPHFDQSKTSASNDSRKFSASSTSDNELPQIHLRPKPQIDQSQASVRDILRKFSTSSASDNESVPTRFDLTPKIEPLPEVRHLQHQVRNILRKFSTSSSENESLLSSSSTSVDDSEPGKKKKLLSSSEDDMSVDIAEIKSAGSIHDRLKRLQRENSEEKWRKKPSRTEVHSSVSERLNRLKTNEEKWKKNSGSNITNRVEKLSERIARIKEDSKNWQARTGQQNDAAQFTIQAKLAKKEGKRAIAVLPSPSIKRRVLPAIVPTHVITEKEAKKSDDSASMNQLSFVERLAKKGLEENVLKKSEVRTTEVPTIDHEEFEKFFVQTPIELMNGDSEMKVEIEELPEIESSTKLSDLGRLKSSIKQGSKRKPSSRNPMKALAARSDLKQSYDFTRSNIVTLEQQRIAAKRGHATFTSAALAGLAARADLSKVNLRSAKNTPMPSNDDLRPFKDVMLLKAKGRRQVQTRLVEPCPKSLCSNDAFLLVTPKKLFAWFGEFCNVIERAKINEIADYIVIKGDLGCKVSALNSIEEVGNQTRHKEFWDLLGGLDEWDKTTDPAGDEQFEIDSQSTIKTYKMVDSKLIPHEDAWGKLPKMGMLGSSDTYVFDFGAEMYIWQGKDVSFADRRLAVRLARVIWNQGFDYTEQGVCPFHAGEFSGKRPEFGLFARVNENLETSLFQEKFEDWSNIHREIGEEEAVMRETSRGKAVKESKTKSSIVTEMVACDVTKMVENVAESSPLLIEGFDISNGDGDIIDTDGRILEIVTTSVETYHVTENNVEKFDDSVLHRSNSYVVKWKYSISSTGRFKSSKQGHSRSESANGRHRVAYFVWAGSDSGVNDKGASALIASNMDTDDGPTITIDEPTAPQVFSKCFHGNMVIMDGKRGERRGAYNWRLFQVKGHSAESSSLVEVPCESKSLRSCSSFVVLMPRDTVAIVWHGCRSPSNVRDAAEEAIKKVSDRMPGSMPFRKNPTCLNITICEEGKEVDKFWEAVGIKRRHRYECLLDVSKEQRITRAWKFTVESEAFVAVELCPVERETLFPLVQEQLQEVEKPSLVLLDCTHGVFLWQDCTGEELTGSAKRRWDVVRRLAMETTIKYCEENKLQDALLIEAGFEPTPLTNAFPSWKTKEKSKFDKSLTQKPRLVKDILSTLSRLTYTLEELRAPQLPEGVDARHLETYLTTADFENLFGISRNEFYEMPAWKQTKMRKAKNLF